MIKIEIDVRDPDYDSLIDRFLPLMVERLRQSDSPAGRLISAGLPESMIKAVIRKLPASSKDQFAAELINSNKDKLAELLKELAGRNGVPLEIGDIKARQEGS